MSFVVVAYYTRGTIYEDKVRTLANSLRSLGLKHDIQAIDSLGSWEKNTHYKPKFILEMLDKYPHEAIVYTDADSQFLQYPILFDTICCDIAIHLLDHSVYKRRKALPEILSGTIYFGNTPKARQIIKEWQAVCKSNPLMWDQKALQMVLDSYGYVNLPPQYCAIYDYMESVPNKVIIHYQASREARKLERMKHENIAIYD